MVVVSASSLSGRLRIIKFVDEHNHPLSHKIYENYTEVRLFTVCSFNIKDTIKFIYLYCLMYSVVH